MLIVVQPRCVKFVFVFFFLIQAYFSLTGIGAPKARSTSKATLAARAPDIDQMPDFRAQNKLKLSSFHTDVEQKVLGTNKLGSLAWSEDKRQFSIHSENRDGPIHLFSLFFTLNVLCNNILTISFEAYSGLKLLRHPVIETIRTWDQFDELCRFVRLSSSHFDEKIKHLERQVQLLNAPRGSHKLYSKDDCLKAFSWYTVSRSLYSKLRDYMVLPSISTLRNITRIAKNMGDLTIFRAFFSSQEERSRNCIVVVDEVHVQASVTYRGGFLKYR